MMTKHILMLGVDYKKPKGGVAQVISVYSSFYEPFHFIPTTLCKSLGRNLICYGIAYLKFIYYLTFNKEIKIIHIHTSSFNSFFRKKTFMTLAKLWNKKVILHIHGGNFQEFTSYRRHTVLSTLQKADAIIALSQSWKDFFENQCGCKRVTVIKNIIEKPQPMVHTKNDKLCRFLFLGYLNSQKGIYDLLETIHKNREALQGKMLLQIGGNGEKENVKEFIRIHKLESLIEYVGWVAGERKQKLLSQADVYILPSYTEGLPISVLEAMSYHLPIITTPVGGLPEIISHGVNGLLIKPGHKQQLIEAMLHLIESPELRKSMGKESAIRVQQHMPEAVEESLNKLYTNILKS